jgi:acyl carrier protein
VTNAEIREAVLRALGGIAPEVATATIPGDVPLREVVDLDSVDFLNFVVALDEALGVDVPETDYPELATLDGCVTYLTRRLTA